MFISLVSKYPVLLDQSIYILSKNKELLNQGITGGPNELEGIRGGNEPVA